MAETKPPLWKIGIANTPEQVGRCSAVMRELRPHIEAIDFAARVLLQQKEGYQLAFLELDGVIRSVAGIRILNLLFSGRTLYIDDLVTRDSLARTRRRPLRLARRIREGTRLRAPHSGFGRATLRRPPLLPKSRHGHHLASLRFEAGFVIVLPCRAVGFAKADARRANPGGMNVPEKTMSSRAKSRDLAVRLVTHRGPSTSLRYARDDSL
jgi:hypothetical protein